MNRQDIGISIAIISVALAVTACVSGSVILAMVFAAGIGGGLAVASDDK